MRVRTIGASALVRELGPSLSAVTGRTGQQAAYGRLADRIRFLIHDGRIGLGSALPSERSLAVAIGVSRTTVTSTYAQLRSQGYLVSRQGTRSLVTLPATPGDKGSVLFRPDVAPGADQLLDLGYITAETSPGAIEPYYQQALQQLPDLLASHGMDRVGLLGLREVLAERYSSRGLPTVPEQIMVTSGAQHALGIILGCLTSPGDRIVVDHPTYPAAIMAMRHAGLRIVPVSVSADADKFGGWDIDGIRDAIKQSDAGIAYVTADFHNPTGMCLNSEGRARLARIAHTSRAPLIVDEALVDLGLDGQPPPPVASFAPDNVDVITLGSMSKSFWGGLRIGWLRAEAGMVARLVGFRTAVDLGTPPLEQVVALSLLADSGELLEKRRRQLLEQRAALRDALDRLLPDWKFHPNAGGVSLWIEMPEARSTMLTAAAFRQGVLLVPGPQFGVHGAFERHLRLPFTRSSNDLRRAIELVATAYRSMSGTET